MELKLDKIGDDLVIVIPAEAVSTLQWKRGDILSAEVANDMLKIVRTKTVHDCAMDIADRVMAEYRETFEALAKS
jgi:putative addiction module antidote